MTAASNRQRKRRASPGADLHPHTVIWETTQACEGDCRQHGGCSGPKHHPDELTTREGTALLTAIAAMGTPEVQLGGGDPALRHDLLALVSHARDVGLAVTLAASSTPTMTPKRLAELKRAGLTRVGVRIDGYNAETHDARHGREGAFAEALRLLGDADAVGLETRIKTTVHAGNDRHLSTMSYLVAELGAASWAVLFEPGTTLSPARAEELWHALAAFGERGDFRVHALGAPALARVRLQRAAARGLGDLGSSHNDGGGLMFVSHVGEITPSPWLPLSAGNVRSDDLARTYREHALFVGLRDADSHDGRCGVCEFRVVCGGSRARAYRSHGSLRASDPLCAHVPPEPRQKRR
ncbi:MAG: radical SAM protein [Polyangiaceae bacterium]|nr:radical SAM protein [Polyangiaceae bacterium]